MIIKIIVLAVDIGDLVLTSTKLLVVDRLTVACESYRQRVNA